MFQCHPTLLRHFHSWQFGRLDLRPAVERPAPAVEHSSRDQMCAVVLSFKSQSFDSRKSWFIGQSHSCSQRFLLEEPLRGREARRSCLRCSERTRCSLRGAERLETSRREYWRGEKASRPSDLM